jgi:hypothetical protein
LLLSFCTCLEIPAFAPCIGSLSKAPNAIYSASSLHLRFNIEDRGEVVGEVVGELVGDFVKDFVGELFERNGDGFLCFNGEDEDDFIGEFNGELVGDVKNLILNQR